MNLVKKKDKVIEGAEQQVRLMACACVCEKENPLFQQCPHVVIGFGVEFAGWSVPRPWQLLYNRSHYVRSEWLLPQMAGVTVKVCVLLKF